MHVLHAKSAKAVQSTEWISSSTLTNMSTIILYAIRNTLRRMKIMWALRAKFRWLFHFFTNKVLWVLCLDIVERIHIQGLFYVGVVSFFCFSFSFPILTDEMGLISAAFICFNVKIYTIAQSCNLCHALCSSVWQSRSFMALYNYWVSSTFYEWQRFHLVSLLTLNLLSFEIDYNSIVMKIIPFWIDAAFNILD